MVSTFRRSFSGLSTLSGRSQACKSEQSTGMCFQGDDETGSWNYLVVDSSGVRPRKDPVYTKDTRSDLPRVREGTIVTITTRRRGGLTTWLLHEGGWLHDLSPKDHKVRLIEVDMAHVSLQYKVVGSSVLVQQKPLLQHMLCPPSWSAVAGKCLETGTLVSVSQRVRPINGKGSFLKLSDGRGWVSDMIKDQQVLSRVEDACSPKDVSSVEKDTSHSQHLPVDLESTRGTWDTELTVPEQGAEHGEWDYVVLDAGGMHLRREPTYNKAAKLSCKLPEGQVVKVVERRCGNGTTFLRLDSPAGWAFDVQPTATARRQRLAEIAVEDGSWFYRVAASRGAPLRSRCSAGDEAKLTGRGSRRECGALLEVCQRITVGDSLYLRITATDSWVAERKHNKLLVEGPLDVNYPTEDNCMVQVRPERCLHLLSSPTKRRWAQTNMVLLKGARVQLVHSIVAEDETWSYVKQPRGMEGWSFAWNFETVGTGLHSASH